MEGTGLAVYVAASLALIATPGQDMLYVVSRSLAQGRGAGVCSAFGVSLGILVHTALAALGIGALLQASPALFTALKFAGAAYLAWLGLRLLLRPRRSLDADADEPPAPPRVLIVQGLVSNVTNPKVLLFFIAFLPQFVDPASAHPTATLVALGSLYAAMALVVKSGVGFAAGALAQRLRRRPAAVAWIDRASGALLVGLGLRLAFSPR